MNTTGHGWFRRQYAVNEHFFDDIDTEQKAYALGYVLGDGCLSKSGELILVAAEGDSDAVSSILAAMEAENPLRRVMRDTNFAQHPRPYMRVGIKSATLARALLSHGIVPNKTHSDVVPVAPKGLEGHFFRGLWDADGWISRNARDKSPWTIGLSGNRAEVRLFARWLREISAGDLKATVSVQGPIGHCVRVTGTIMPKFVLEHLYAGATISLTRKRLLYENLLREVRERAVRWECPCGQRGRLAHPVVAAERYARHENMHISMWHHGAAAEGVA